MLNLGALEGFLCVLIMLMMPAGSGSGSLFRFSLSKALLTGSCALFALILWLLSKSGSAIERIAQRLEKSGPSRFLILTLSVLIIVFTAAALRSVWLLYQTSGIYRYRIIFERTLPPGIWLCLIAAQFLFLCLKSGDGINRMRASFSLSQRRMFLVLILLGFLFGIFVALIRIGLVKDNAFFGKPTVPLLGWHIGLTALLMVCLNGNAYRPDVRRFYARQIKWLPCLIWLAAVIIWLAIPNQHGFFSPWGRAPNFETYPFSDGSFYGHYARSVAAGMGYKGTDIPPRPLYILFLALAHLISGTGYDSVILIQTLVLAFLPVMLYLIGKELHGATAGFGAALAYILRETNAILSAPFAHNVSTTKYFFSDLPTALAAMFFIWALIKWIKSLRAGSEASISYAVLCGGGLGLITLIRTQSLVLTLIPVISLIALKNQKMAVKIRHFAFFSIAMLCCLMPWLIRNHSITGEFVFDHPATQTGEMAASYNIGGLDMTREPGMNDGAYSKKLTAVLSESVRRYPKEIARFISAHFFNNLISSFRVFPIRNSLAAVSELFRPQTAFWETLDNSQLFGGALISFYLWLLIFCWGAAAAFRKLGAVGMLPLTAFLLFNLSTAIGRYSAGRYLIPMDWVLFSYLFIGIADWLRSNLIAGGLLLAEQADEPIGAACSAPQTARRWLPQLLMFLAIGAAVPLLPKAIPMRFSPESKTAVLEKLALDPADPAYYSADALVTKAIALYPRYYAAYEGEPESAKQGYGAEPYGRLIFLILSPDHFGTIELPLDQAPAFFPDNAAIWLEGKGNGATSIAKHVYVEADGVAAVYEADRLPGITESERDSDGI